MRDQSKSQSLQARRFSIFNLLAITTVVAVGCSLAIQHQTALWTTLFTCLWCTFFAKLAQIGRPFWIGFTVGAIDSVFAYAFFTSSPFPVEVILIPVTAPILALNIWGMCRWQTRQTPDTHLPNGNLNKRRRQAGKRSLAALAFTPICFLEVASGGEFEVFSAAFLSFFATVPWLVFWRRNRLAGFAFKKNWIDKLSWLLAAAAFWIGLVSLLPMTVFCIFEYFNIPFDPPTGGIQRAEIGFFLFSIATLFFSNVASLVLVTTGLVIQWYRDRWWKTLNWMATIYSLFLLLACVAMTRLMN